MKSFQHHIAIAPLILLGASLIGCDSKETPDLTASDDIQESVSDNSPEGHVEVEDHYRAIGEVMVANALLQHHWQGLETNGDFKPVVEELCDSFTIDQFNWGSIRPAVNNPRDDQTPSNAFERDLLKSWAGNKKPGDYLLQKTPKGIWFYKPIYHTSLACVICHRLQNENVELVEGDLQGIIRVRLAGDSEQTQGSVPSQASKDR